MTRQADLARSSAVQRALGAAEFWIDVGMASQDPASVASKVLAGCARLRRIFPKVPSEANFASEVVLQHRDEILAAWTRMDFDRWFERARRLDHSLEGAYDPAHDHEMSSAAVDLFDELEEYGLAIDEVRELTKEAATHSNCTDRAFAEWKRALAYFDEHVEIFLPAASFAEIILAICRFPEELSPFLWETTLPARRLTEFADSMGDELEASPAELFAWAQFLTTLSPAKGRPETRPTLTADGSELVSWDWLPSISFVGLAAATTKPSAGAALHWSSPDRSLEAIAFQPSAQSEILRIHFHRGDFEATELAGTQASLGDVSVNINAQARADFPLKDLRDSGQRGAEGVLRAGPFAEPWTLVARLETS